MILNLLNNGWPPAGTAEYRAYEDGYDEGCNTNPQFNPLPHVGELAEYYAAGFSDGEEVMSEYLDNLEL